MAEKLKRLGRLLLDIAWAAMILLLPFTSLPLVSKLMGGTMVAPASLIPLGFLGMFWFLFYLFKKGTLPREIVPLLLFVTIALIASALGFFRDIPTFKHAGIANEEISGIVTVLIGLAFYALSAAWLAGSEQRLRFTLKLISIGGAVMLGWALVQGFFIYFRQNEYPEILSKIQTLISYANLYPGRMTGTAIEPSWMADEMNLIYLPFWLAATLTGWSAFRLRVWKITLENLLLVIGAGILFLSSRVGLLSFLLVIAFLIVYFNVWLAGRIRGWSLKRLARFPTSLKKFSNLALPVLIFMLFLLVYTGAIAVLVYAVGKVDWRVARLFDFSTLLALMTAPNGIYAIFQYLAFAERVTFWQAGWNIFNLHPFLGVGLGNAGFFFPTALPAYAWNLPEVMNNLYRFTSVPNIKSFWIRLLAETGIVGFSAFVAWFIVMFRSAWPMRKNPSNLFRVIGWAGAFVLIAFIFEGFSVDTFALPYLWVSLGIVSAAAFLIRRNAPAK